MNTLYRFLQIMINLTFLKGTSIHCHWNCGPLSYLQQFLLWRSWPCPPSLSWTAILDSLVWESTRQEWEGLTWIWRIASFSNFGPRKRRKTVRRFLCKNGALKTFEVYWGSISLLARRPSCRHDRSHGTSILGADKLVAENSKCKGVATAEETVEGVDDAVFNKAMKVWNW